MSVNSLGQFLAAVGDDVFEGKTSIRLEDFQKKYESFCVPRLLEEDSVFDNPNTLARYNMKVQQKSDITTRIYRHIQLSATAKAAGQPFAGENSLEFFIRTQCKLTPHDVDYVFVELFKKAVSTFEKTSHTPYYAGIFSFLVLCL